MLCIRRIWLVKSAWFVYYWWEHIVCVPKCGNRCMGLLLNPDENGFTLLESSTCHHACWGVAAAAQSSQSGGYTHNKASSSLAPAELRNRKWGAGKRAATNMLWQSGWVAVTAMLETHPFFLLLSRRGSFDLQTLHMMLHTTPADGNYIKITREA